MIFYVQASCPRIYESVSELEDNLKDAVEDAYHEGAEHLFLNWNGTCVALDYKYDISWIIEDLLELLSELVATDSGKSEVHWPSNGFQSVWKVAWKDGKVAIEAQWASVNGGVEEILSRSGSVQIGVEDFLAEWKKPLERVLFDLRKLGYTEEILPELRRLQSLYLRIPNYGVLYR